MVVVVTEEEDRRRRRRNWAVRLALYFWLLPGLAPPARSDTAHDTAHGDTGSPEGIAGAPLQRPRRTLHFYTSGPE